MKPKIDLEIVDKIVVKVATCNTKIIFLLLCNCKMSNLTSNISAISESIFIIIVENFLNLLKLTHLLYFGREEADKITKKSVPNIVGYPVAYSICYH